MNLEYGGMIRQKFAHSDVASTVFLRVCIANFIQYGIVTLSSSASSPLSVSSHLSTLSGGALSIYLRFGKKIVTQKT